MKLFTFPVEHKCPLCQAQFNSAEIKQEYHPVVVVLCPNCFQMLWRPGLDETSPLFAFDPEADSGGI